jgi:hypothetical protein
MERNLTGENLIGENLIGENLIGEDLIGENHLSLRLDMVITPTATIHALEKAIIHILISHIVVHLHFAIIHHHTALRIMALRIMALHIMVLRITVHQRVLLANVHPHHMMAHPRAHPTRLQKVRQTVIP